MSGPDFFRPRYGSNAIGTFTIGVSPIGSIAAFDMWDTIISQYANSPRLVGILDGFNQCVDQTANMDAFYDLIWSVASAQGHGLDIWGRIVGVVRTVSVPSGDYFGFEEANIGANPFNQQPFYQGAPLSDNFDLSDTAFRQLIYAKALFNISDGSIPAINQILRRLFPGRGNCYVIDGLDMTMTYKFEFQLTSVELSVLGQSGALPKPTGVSSQIVVPAT